MTSLAIIFSRSIVFLSTFSFHSVFLCIIQQSDSQALLRILLTQYWILIWILWIHLITSKTIRLNSSWFTDHYFISPLRVSLLYSKFLDIYLVDIFVGLIIKNASLLLFTNKGSVHKLLITLRFRLLSWLIKNEVWQQTCEKIRERNFVIRVCINSSKNSL